MDENVARSIHGRLIEEGWRELDEVNASALSELCTMVGGPAGEWTMHPQQSIQVAAPA